jgi:predicted cobalt transporter CbtA
MLRTLLICGLVAGALAAVLATGFATVAGEPAVDGAIAFEDAQARAAHDAPAAAVVSRTVQKTVGLFTAAAAYCVALGGLFALAFALVYGRIAVAPPGRTARWLALAAFVVVFLVPFLKYPANPPSVGDPDTIGRRTELYLVMVAASLLSALAAVNIRAWMLSRPALRAYATLGGLATYAVVVTVAAVGLPGIHEVPADFPATTLWRFREASIGLQVVLWSTVGLVFGHLAQRVMTRAGAARPEPAAAAVAPGVERAR